MGHTLPPAGVGQGPRWFSLRRLGWSYRDTGAAAVLLTAASAVVVNALFMQAGPHPAPIFHGVFAPVSKVAATDPKDTKDTTGDVAPRTREPAAKTEPVKKTEP